MTKFAVNVIGYIEDPLGKYTANDIERMLNNASVTECFRPLHTVAVIAKQLPDDSISLDASKVKKRYKFTE